MAELVLTLADLTRRWKLCVHPEADPRPTVHGTVLTPRRLLLTAHHRRRA
ncbi:hypothetical protein ABZ615_11685 [Streptomyces sp. NPDC007325]